MFFLYNYCKSRATATTGSPGNCRYTSNSKEAKNSREATRAGSQQQEGGNNSREATTEGRQQQQGGNNRR
jgi:hypothetical protein